MIHAFTSFLTISNDRSPLKVESICGPFYFITANRKERHISHSNSEQAQPISRKGAGNVILPLLHPIAHVQIVL
jgi:hypothetical protein